jgi:hypothetical protein
MVKDAKSSVYKGKFDQFNTKNNESVLDMFNRLNDIWIWRIPQVSLRGMRVIWMKLDYLYLVIWRDKLS